jgi:predicted nucleotidyltransferase
MSEFMPIEQSDIIQALSDLIQQHGADYHITRIGLFGSAARNQMKSTSDIDVVVQLERQDIFALIGIKQELESALHTRVDVVSYRNGMNPLLKRRIDTEAVYAGS